MTNHDDSMLLSKLKNTLNKMELSLGVIRDVIIWINEKGIVQWCNKKFPKLIDLPSADILGKPIYKLISLKRNDKSANWEEIFLDVSGKQAANYHFNIYQFEKNNITHLFKISSNQFFSSKAENSIIVVLHDVTESEQAKEQIKFLASIPANSAAPVFSVNANNEIIFTNKAAKKLIKTWQIQFNQLLPESFIPWIEKSLQDHKEYLVEETSYQLTYLFSIIPASNGEYVNIYGTNVTKRKKAEKELVYLSHHDILTGLYNRSAFENILKHETFKSQQNNTMFAILLLDIDNFKAVNDTFGHHIGDQLLITIAKQLQESVRKEDFVARLGGDEFVIVLSNIKNVADVNELAEHLIKRFNKPFKLNSHYFHATISIGIALSPKSAQDETTLIKNADIALYAVKELGRNNYQIFSDKVHYAFERRTQLESGLQSAIAEKQFFLVYQPEYKLPNKQIAGIEVLLRWQHPELGLIMPDEFIPIAEKNGLIVPISEWVLKQACTQYMRWESQGLIQEGIKLAINVSPQQLGKRGFMHSFLDTLKETGMSAKNLELELTETAVMTSTIDLDPIFDRLHKIGTSISIDDFGIGYSSLTRLKNLPVSTLKIDKSFIKDLSHDLDNAMIVKSIIALGSSLGLNVIPAGVETEEQLKLLLQFHCSMVQGFYFGKHPLNADEMSELLLQSIPQT